MASPARLLSAAPLLALLLATPLTAQPPATSAPASTAAKQPPGPAGPLTAADIKTLAEAHVAVGVVNDSASVQMAKVKNKTVQAQQELAQRKRTLVAEALQKKGLTEAEYDRQRYLVSANPAMRAQFDSLVAKLTGQALPGTVVAGAPTVPTLPGVLGIEIGYITSNYMETPDKSGLLPMAQAEAKVAAQHAGFMARALDNLATLQMHAGHILHAIDPALMPTAKAPGKGYGFKHALEGVVSYADAAAKDAGASAGVKMHTTHIIGAARGASTRADQVIALARKIQATSSVKDAASMAGELQSLCDQLAAGADLNHDGKIGWDNGEGGLQQIQDHITLMLNGEKKP
jgi:hypothetical protein